MNNIDKIENSDNAMHGLSYILRNQIRFGRYKGPDGQHYLD
jgi:hypothetical protein